MSTAIFPLFGDVAPSGTGARDRALALGLALEVAASLPSHCKRPLAEFATLASCALQVGQMRVYVNQRNECVGYVIWATLTPDVENDYIAGDVRTLAEWELSDGTSAWLLDFAVVQGLLRPVLEDLRDVVFRNHEQLSYFRVKRNQRLCKRVSRSDRTTFMSVDRRPQELTE